MTGRVSEDGETIHRFMLEPIDVRCPRCDGHARLAKWSDGEPALLMPRRLVCHQCGFTRDHGGDLVATFAEGRDPCFGYPLWFRTDTSKGTLWAYHRSHLEVLRSYIAASHRERTQLDTWHNRSTFSRLPSWIKSAKNRELVVKALDQLLADP